MPRLAALRAGAVCAALTVGVGLACKNSIEVVFLVPGSMEMAPSDTVIPQGGSFQLRVTVYDTTGDPIPLLPTLTSSDTSRVTVSRTGLVRAAGPTGSVSITATLGPFTRITNVDVIDSLLAARVPLGGRPYGAAISSTGVAYVTQLDFGRLARANLPAQAFTASAAVGSIPSEVAFNSTGALAYVTNQFSGNVAVVNVATNTWIDTIPVTGDPFDVIVTPGDSIIYVSTNVDSVYGIRVATKAVVARFPTPAIANGFVIRADTLLYVSTHGGGTVIEFNLRTRTVARTFTVGGTPQKLALSANGNELYIANEAGYVQFWNLVGGGQIGTNLSLPGGGGYGMTRRASNGLLYVSTATGGPGNVHIINATTRTITRTIAVGGRGRRVVFNASGTIGFVPNEGGWVDFLR